MHFIYGQKTIRALSDIDIYFNKTFNLNENEVNIQKILAFFKSKSNRSCSDSKPFSK